MKKLSFLAAFFLTACVTINIYFPAAAAEKVADEIIKEIQVDTPADQSQEPAAQSGLSKWQISAYKALDRAISVVISSAHADANLSADSAEIRRIKASMQARFPLLNGYYNNGMVGIKADGLLAIKGNVSLRELNKVKKLIAAENADRNKLYQAIANANGHPEWVTQIKSTFAASWINNAQSGWWYQGANGRWLKK